MGFQQVLEKYRNIAFSERDKGDRFERLMQLYLKTDPKYAHLLQSVWLWSEFPYKSSFGGRDIGIDLVGLTIEGEYWAIQCKCYKADARIDKPAVDSFLATSSRGFTDENNNKQRFAQRLWISTTNNWGPNASESLKNQIPPVTRLNLFELIEAPVDWDKLENGLHGEEARTPKKTLRPHQMEALEKVHEHFKTADRGKLIMACGTGKTFNALRIAEHETDGNGVILFLVPSIALLGQTLREWSADANEDINAICICSDPAITKKTTKNEDTDTFSVIDLALPATTNTDSILKQFQYYSEKKKDGMIVVFSTYQSIDVIAKAQKKLLDRGYSEFDLIICDEAHRTTGVTLEKGDESAFVKVHDNSFLKAKKRIYMTATPRLYSDDSKSKAAQAEAYLCSMDDEELYGKEVYRIGFGEAVERDLLTDYKVLILTLDDSDVPTAIQKIYTDGESEVKIDDLTKLIGTINALSKYHLTGDNGTIKETDPAPMKRAVAFCANIKNSQSITSTYNILSKEYIDAMPDEKKVELSTVEAKHIDGTMSAPERDKMIGWLKEETDDNECRVITNVRVLSEGVDVPTLDAVLFLSAKNSQIDVVQSVGRVMRKAPGKKYGYIIIPVVVPSDIPPEKALDDNERFKVVWTVLNALRAHDDRFNAIVNKIDLNRKASGEADDGSGTIIIIGTGNGNGKGNDYGDTGVGSTIPKSEREERTKKIADQLSLQFERLQGLIYAKMVQKVGDKRYWEQWAKDIAQIAERQIERITYLVNNNGEQKQAFEEFLLGLQKNINPSINDKQAIEMLAQHLITEPVFEALFEGYSFVKNNAVSQSMQIMVDALEGNSIAEESEILQKFYDSVKRRAEGITNAEGKQRIIIELYDKFFKAAFPKMVEQLGIVYTPVEVVDFIIHSVNDILKKEFGRSLSDENIHILDPFTGTGTFISRLLQSGLIRVSDLERKYKNELHANEIVLLAYYIAAINIENAYHDATPDPDDGIGKANYTPFDGIVLTDTFQLGESEDIDKLFSDKFPKNSERVARQKKAPLRVIIGNPPYSIGQKSANDNAQNQSYPKLDQRIADTYAKQSSAGLSKSLYDAYIKAFRWSSDRLDPKNGGIIAFITNSGWLDGNGADGFRKTLEQEFSSIYVINLRGAVRGRQGDAAKREGQNVFDIMTGVAITLLVKNPYKTIKATIQYHDIGNFLSRKEKINQLNTFKHIGSNLINWGTISPNVEGDWLNQRNSEFENYSPLAPIKKLGLTTKSIFKTYAIGIASNRDSWVYNFSKIAIKNNMMGFINFYNEQVTLYNESKLSNIKVEEFVDSDYTKISWTRGLRKDVKRARTHYYDNTNISKGLYRPFCKINLYFDRDLIESPGIFNQLFPHAGCTNLIITLPGLGERRGFATLISDSICDLNIYDGGSQCFPLYYYEERDLKVDTLFDHAVETETKYVRKYAISDHIYELAKKQYQAKNITKEDIFYYVYGFLHSKEYREMFANDLKKMLPRLPLVEDVKDFWAFSNAGRKLADLHLNYETVPAYEELTVTGAESEFYTVEKMRYPKKDKKDTILYNSKITISNIPEKAYEYVINGKSAIEWIMERYQVTIHKESQIKNDPNDWAKEVGNPRYILDLLLSIVNVSVQTVDIVNSLPKIDFNNNESVGNGNEYNL